MTSDKYPPPDGTPESMVTSIDATATPGVYLLNSGSIAYLGFSGDLAERTVPAAVDFLAAALATCAIGLIRKTAQAQQDSIGDLRVETTVRFDLEDGSRFQGIALDFIFDELDDDRATAYIQLFATLCPIYNTVRQGTAIELFLRSASNAPERIR